MNRDWLKRTEDLIGFENIEKLAEKKVIVFGLGGVGGAACEALVRTGIGSLAIVDKDAIEESNLNRQLIALRSNLGKSKVEAMKERALDINPDLLIESYHMFFLPESSEEINLTAYDYIVDAIDNITGKIQLIVKAKRAGIPIISSMAMGNRKDPLQITVGDIYETQGCSFSKILRKELKASGVNELKVVWSKEEAIKIQPPASSSFVPPVAGYIMASIVAEDLTRS